MRNYKIYLIRNGLTDGAIEGRYIGHTDEELNEEGKKQLTELVTTGYYPEVEAVFSSPLKRCVQTAQMIYPDKEPILLRELIECDFGDFEGYNYDELKDNPAYQAWLASGGELPFPRGESRMEFSERCVKAFESSAAHLSEGNYAFIVHGGTIMAVMEYFTNGSYYNYQVRNGKGFILNADGSYEVL